MIRPGELDEPNFEKTSKVHDWRNHVGRRTKAIWFTLSPEQRAAIAMDADDEASAEVWE